MLLLSSQGETPTASHYLFIDGEYLDIVYKQSMNRLFGNEGDLSLEPIKNYTNVNAYRVFYYNSLDDAQREGEPDDVFKERVQKQLDHYDKISSIPGFHVRLGSVTGNESAANDRRWWTFNWQLTLSRTHSVRTSFMRRYSRATSIS